MAKAGRINVRLEPSTRMTLRTSDLSPNIIQPMNRIQPSAVATLKEKIVESRFIAPLVVVRRRNAYIICDGHRRWSAAQELGVESLQCDVLTNTDAEALFVLLNTGIKNMKGEAWLTVFAHSIDADANSNILRIMPKRVQRQIEDMVDIFGIKRVIQIGLEGKQSPGLSQSVMRLEAIFRTYGLSMPRNKIGEWIMAHKAQRDVIELNKKGISSRDARRWFVAVEKNREAPDGRGRAPKVKRVA